MRRIETDPGLLAEVGHLQGLSCSPVHSRTTSFFSFIRLDKAEVAGSSPASPIASFAASFLASSVSAQLRLRPLCVLPEEPGGGERLARARGGRAHPVEHADECALFGLSRGRAVSANRTPLAGCPELVGRFRIDDHRACPAGRTRTYVRIGVNRPAGSERRCALSTRSCFISFRPRRRDRGRRRGDERG